MILSNIKSIAKKRGVTLSQIEKDLQMGRGAITKMEKHEPSAVRLKMIADYLNVSMDTLMEGVVVSDRPAD